MLDKLGTKKRTWFGTLEEEQKNGTYYRNIDYWAS